MTVEIAEKNFLTMQWLAWDVAAIRKRGSSTVIIAVWKSTVIRSYASSAALLRTWGLFVAGHIPR